MASDTAYYSTYIHSQGTDLEEFKRTTDEIGGHLGKLAEAAEAQRKAA